MLGESTDASGDPPRVFHAAAAGGGGGCAFTRSIGDMSSEQWGVIAEPELMSKGLTPTDQFLVLASDGVWEFLTNQQVADSTLHASLRRPSWPPCMQIAADCC